MLYLVDANVLIDAQRDYYPRERVPEFWDWLLDQGRQGSLKVPVEIFEEIVSGRGELVDWLSTVEVKTEMLFDAEIDPSLVRVVLARGYAPDLRDDELDKLGRDPFLVAHATAAEGRCVVTTETSKPTAKRANRRIPDVCAANNVECCNTFEMTRRLNFTTGWRR